MVQISIIIPTHSRPTQLVSCVGALAQLDFERSNYEVIVVDDGSPEPLNRSLLPNSSGLNLTLVHQPQKGPGGARNAGAKVARGALLAFTDDDCQPAPDWLGELAAKHAKAPDRLIGGCTINGLPHNLCAITSQLIVDVAYIHYNSDPESPRFFAANNIAVPTGLFRRIGGFDEDFRMASEDRELCDRWLHSGYEMTCAPNAVVFHGNDLTLPGFCRQHFNYGRGAHQFHQARARRGSGTLRSEFKFHSRFLTLLRTPVSKLRPADRHLVCALLGLWQLVNVGGYLFAFARARLTTKKVPS